MSVSHLRALEEALSGRGWRVVATYPGDDYRISASWELRRSGREGSLLVDFDGMGPDGDVCLPVEESYGCRVRGCPGVSLYFRRVNRSRQLWEQELADFVRSLDDVGRFPDRNSPS
jgi:hypothetical protein